MTKTLFAAQGFTSAILIDEKKERIEAREGTFPLRGLIAVVESEDVIRRRVSIGRVAAIGVFSLLAKKDKAITESYLLIETPDHDRILRTIPSKKLKEAHKFADKINALSLP